MRAVLIGFFLSSAFLTVGCKQGNGDRCVQNSDCSSGLCSSNGIPQGGTCVVVGGTSTGTGGETATGGQGGAAGEGGAAGQGGANMSDAAPPSDAASG